MSHTTSRILQYIVIILVLAGISGAGYAFYQSRAAVVQKSASKSGLIGYWNFEEGTGTSAGDMSGNSTTGTLTNGPTWVDGRHGKAIDLDGSNDYVTMGSAATYDDLGAFTVSAWINPDSVTASPRVIIGKTAAGATTGWTVGQSGAGIGKIFVQVMCSSGDLTLRSSNSVLSAGKWQHVTFVYDGTTAYVNQHIYINGIETSYDTAQSTNCGGSRISDAAQDLMLGRDSSTGTYIYGGLEDEVRLYNRTLSASEVAAIYNAGIVEVSTSQNSSLTNGLAGIWSFDGADISGTTAYDRSTNANNGTLTNGPVAARGKIGQAFNFDGTDDYVTAGSPVSLDDISTLTTCAWIYPETMPAESGYRIIDRKTSGSGGGWEFWLYNYYGYLIPGFYRYFSTTNGHWFGDIEIAVGTWTHLCVTYDNSSASNDPVFSVNGMPVATEEQVAPSGTAASDAAEEFRIAWSPSSGFFDGPIDDVRVYNRILSAGEIGNLYQLGADDKVNAAASQLDPLRSGLAAYWKLDENTGTSAADASTNGKSGTLTSGPTWTTGRIGSGVTLDGTNDYIDIGTSSALADDLSRFSVSTWFNTSTTTCSADCMLVSKLSTGSTNTGIGWALVGNYYSGSMGQLFFFTKGPTTSDWRGKYTNRGTYDDGAWHHVLVTYDSGTILMYVDGVPESTTSDDGGTIGSISNAANVRIGADTDGNYFPGTVDEVRLYDRVLSAEEAARLYKTTAPDDPDTGLKAYWPFNGSDISGTTAYDRSGSGINGTLTNGPVPSIGKIGQGVSFDGTDDFVSTAASVGITGSKTVSFWMKADIIDSNNRRIFYSADSTASDYMIAIFYDGFFGVVTDDVYSPIHRTTSGGSALLAGQWYHIAITKTTNNINEIYVNGAAAGTVMSDYSTATDGTITEVGGSLYNSPDFDGTIDDVRIYGRVLSATEILALYNQGK